MRLQALGLERGCNAGQSLNSRCTPGLDRVPDESQSLDSRCTPALNRVSDISQSLKIVALLL